MNANTKQLQRQLEIVITAKTSSDATTDLKKGKATCVSLLGP